MRSMIDRALARGKPEELAKALQREKPRSDAVQVALNQHSGHPPAVRREMIEMLLKAGAPPSNMAFHSALSSDQHEIVLLLARYGADVNVRDSNGSTPLHKAVYTALRSGRVDTMLFLMNHKDVDVSRTDNSGRTAFQLAAENPNRGVYGATVLATVRQWEKERAAQAEAARKEAERRRIAALRRRQPKNLL